MRDGDFRIRSREISRVEGLSDAVFGFAILSMRRVVVMMLACVACVACVACSESKAPPPPPHAPTIGAAPAASGCPATGLWAECSVMYRLERAGLAPHVDSGATPNERVLAGRPLLLKIGRMAPLEVFFYDDSIARIADAKKLDRTQLVSGVAQQTMKRERTLIESANVIGLLTSLSSRQRERVSDALNAGPPQP